MAYGNLLTDVVQSSTNNVPPVFKGGNGNEVGQLCRAWVLWNGSGTITKAFNVSSVTQNATGFFTINFTNALPDANYCWTHSTTTPGSAAATISESTAYTSRSTTALGVKSGYYYSGGWIDYSSFGWNSVAVFD